MTQQSLVRDGRGEPASLTIGQYLIDRLHALGVEHVFGIPGDYVLTLYKMIEESPIRLVGMTREDNAGFAADAYARLHGLGCVCVTYCVGGLSLCNSIAGAYAEKSPVIVLGGSPGLSERARNPLLHHKVKGFETQFEVFEKITVASAVLDDPLTAFNEIDRVLEAAVRYKRPVYLEIPRDQVHVRQVRPAPAARRACRRATPTRSARRSTRRPRCSRAAKRPMILADVEIHRFGLQDELLAPGRGDRACRSRRRSWARASSPRGTRSSSASTRGRWAATEVTECVEEADCLLMLGCFLTDINLGIFTAKLDPSRCIDATSEDLRIRHHHYSDVRLDDFIRGLPPRRLTAGPDAGPAPARPARRRPGSPSPTRR